MWTVWVNLMNKESKIYYGVEDMYFATDDREGNMNYIKYLYIKDFNGIHPFPVEQIESYKARRERV